MALVAMVAMENSWLQYPSRGTIEFNIELLIRVFIEPLYTDYLQDKYNWSNPLIEGIA